MFSRLGKAISGNVDVQKEKLNVIVTMKYGNKITTGNIEEQLANAFDRTNKHYQNEFSRYKNNLSSLKGKDSDFISRNNKILNYSDLLLKKYDKETVKKLCQIPLICNANNITMNSSLNISNLINQNAIVQSDISNKISNDLTQNLQTSMPTFQINKVKQKPRVKKYSKK